MTKLLCFLYHLTEILFWSSKVSICLNNAIYTEFTSRSLFNNHVWDQFSRYEVFASITEDPQKNGSFPITLI